MPVAFWDLYEFVNMELLTDAVGDVLSSCCISPEHLTCCFPCGAWMPVSHLQCLVQSILPLDCELDAGGDGICMVYLCTLNAWPQDVVGA